MVWHDSRRREIQCPRDAAPVPVKTCLVRGPGCEGVYWARWGNTPAVCETCALHVIICPACWDVRLRDDDPAQLALFDVEEMERQPSWWRRPLSALVDGHFARRLPRHFDYESSATIPEWPRAATQAERQRYPYH